MEFQHFFREHARFDFTPPTLATRLHKIHLTNHLYPILIPKCLDQQCLEPSFKNKFVHKLPTKRWL